MKKIMFFRPMYYIGGTEMAILSLVRKLEGFDIYIGYIDDESDNELLNKYQKYAKVVKINDDFNERMDTLVICSPYKSSLSINDQIRRDKTILWFHHFGNRDTSIFTDDLFYEIVDEIVTVSETCKKIVLDQDYASKIDKEINVIYNIIDKEEIEKKSEIEKKIDLSDQLNLVSVGRVCYEKGFKRQLQLAHLLKKNNIDFKWYIIGGNYYKEIEHDIREKYNELEDNFVFTGFLDNPFNIMKQCDYLVLLSDNETWGLVITEAKILGVPCIVTDFDVAYEQIIDNETGIILSRNDMSSYEEKIPLIIKNKKIYKENLKSFSWSNDTTIERWKEIL